jgi:hypothetical protein
VEKLGKERTKGKSSKKSSGKKSSGKRAAVWGHGGTSQLSYRVAYYITEELGSTHNIVAAPGCEMIGVGMVVDDKTLSRWTSTLDNENGCYHGYLGYLREPRGACLRAVCLMRQWRQS